MDNNQLSEETKSYLKYMLMLYLRSYVDYTLKDVYTFEYGKCTLFLPGVGDLFKEKTNSKMEQYFKSWLGLMFAGTELATQVDYILELLTKTMDEGLRPTEDVMKTLSQSSNCHEKYYGLLEDIEQKEYDRLKKGYLSVVKNTVKTDDKEFLDNLQKITNTIRHKYNILTKVGSRIIKIWRSDIDDFIKENEKVEGLSKDNFYKTI
ncbi:MAG: hypothetical protein C0172_03405 [Caldisphaera sp.]|nr:MAG: hypothetical protein C0172_03405 [Caldisphaera sp.]